MLDTIEIENFKCFEHLKLRCAPLTVLCGLNGMGKSSVFQALLCLRNYGAFSTLGTPQDVLYDGASADRISFDLGWTGGGRFRAAYRLSQDGSSWEDEDYTRTVAQNEVPSSDDCGNPIWPEDPVAFANAKWDLLAHEFTRIIHVGAERIGPRRIYDYRKSPKVNNAQQASPALFRDLEGNGERTLNYLRNHRSDLLDDADARCTADGRRRLLEVLEHWLQEVAPGAHLDFDVVQDADALIAGFSFDRRGDVRTRRYRMTNVGFGLAYVLPVLAALLAPKGYLCLIENPEAHLHPRGQVRLAELAVRAAIAGVQIIVETHSDHFLDGVRIAVREQLIRPKDTAIHYFERDEGKSILVSPEIDEDGRLSLWPAGFFDQHDESLARLLAPK